MINGMQFAASQCSQRRLERLECATDWIVQLALRQLEQSSRVVIDQYRVDQHADQIL
jgi:hypothetical protein